MSKIALRVGRPSNPAAVVGVIRSITGRSIGDVSRDLRSDLPVVEYTLFGNDHDELAGRLRRLARELTGVGAQVRAYELDEAETLGDVEDRSGAEIPLSTLSNILDAHDREIVRQRALPAEG